MKNHRHPILHYTAFAYAGLLYFLFRSRHGGWGDSIAYLADAVDGFDWAVNATGHFLYTNAMTLAVKAFPWFDPASLLVLFSAVFALLTLIRVYQTAGMLTGNRTAGVLTALTFGLSFTFWRQAEIIEVYTFYHFIVASALYHALSDIAAGTTKQAYRTGVWFGLALITHIQTILLTPFFVWYIVRRGIGRRAIGPLAITAGAVLILVVPAAVSGRLTVASVFFDNGFQDAVLAFDMPQLARAFVKSIAYLLYNFHVWTAVMLWGCVAAFRDRREVGIALGLIVPPVWLFAFRYPVSDSYVFFLNAYLALAVAAGYGYRALLDRMRPAMHGWLVAAVCLSFPAVYGGVLAAGRSVPALGEIDRNVGYKGGLAYYCWPGMEYAPDPFTLAHRQYLTGEPPTGIDHAEWASMYPYAVAYLRHTGVIDERVSE